MPNQPAKDKRNISIQIKRTLFVKIEKLAISHGIRVSDFCRMVLEEACNNVELTAEDYERIAKEIRAAGGN